MLSSNKLTQAGYRITAHLSVIALALLVLLLGGVSKADAQTPTLIGLTNENVTALIHPQTLEVTLSSRSKSSLTVSSGQSGLGHVADLQRTSTQANWKLPQHGITVTARLEHEQLVMDFRAEQPGTFTWPVVEPSATTKAWILPMFEGVYVPVTDEKWSAFLAEHGPLNTTAELGLPFWGLDGGDFTATWIAKNPFNNELTFTNMGGRLSARFTHEFTRNNPVKEFGFVIQLGTASPIAPAKLYRAWLQQRGEFVSLREKIQRTPEAAKLPGASHIYLWGDDALAIDDVKDWKGFGQAMVAAGDAEKDSEAKTVWSALSPETRTLVSGLAKMDFVDRYTKTQIIEALNQLLVRSNSFPNLPTAKSARDAFTQNSQAFARAFPGLLAPRESWGNGISPNMIAQLAAAGLDRLWLGVDGWEGLVRRPEIVTAAKQHGYLIGPYDSYHSIHSPKAKETWETAQFDQPLFETGGIVQANGAKKKGFKQLGYVLSPRAARPYVEKRVRGLMQAFSANSWFMDCDGFGEYFDDYSEAHPATQATDLQARCERMAWIRDTYGAVIGSEGCSAGVAGTIHFAHGVMTPVIGWGDPDLKDKASKYFLGAYYPPDGPAIFLKPVPTKEVYRYIYFEPRFRLPLFETVFHDSVVATHHWTSPSPKFSDVAATVELMELLYNVPPLYHLSLAEFSKRHAQMKKHHDFFSPLHRESALLPLTEFTWLTPDRLVQRTVFGDKIEMVANFGKTDFAFEKTTIPAGSILARQRDSGKILKYVPTGSTN